MRHRLNAPCQESGGYGASSRADGDGGCYRERCAQAPATTADHVVTTNKLTPLEVARRAAGLIGLLA
jgi:hypothetical protein